MRVDDLVSVRRVKASLLGSAFNGLYGVDAEDILAIPSIYFCSL